VGVLMLLSRWLLLLLLLLLLRRLLRQACSVEAAFSSCLCCGCHLEQA
jgi:hypothetical protein